MSKPLADVRLKQAALEAALLLTQAVEALSIPARLVGLLRTLEREGHVSPRDREPAFRMAVKAAVIALYQLKEIRDHFLVWLFSETELRDLGFPPIEEFIDWKAVVTIRGQYSGHVTSKKSTKTRPGQMIKAVVLGEASRRTGVWQGGTFLHRVEKLVPGVEAVRDELRRRYPGTMLFRRNYVSKLRAVAGGRRRACLG